jgi:endoglucanase
MKMRKNCLFILLGFLFLSAESAGQGYQSGPSIPWFNPVTAYRSWDTYKSDVYQGGAARFTNISGDVPVVRMGEVGALLLESVKPSGWWNVIFRIGNGMAVNGLRMGDHPLLHLRLKWEKIARGANLEIQLFSQENNVKAGFPEQSAGVLLSHYLSPVTEWKDVYIPLADFVKVNPRINLTRIHLLRFVGTGFYADTNRMLIERMEIVPSVENPYQDAWKVNQVGFLPQQQKLAFISFDKQYPPEGELQDFSLVAAGTDSVVFRGKLVKKTPYNTEEWGQDGDVVYHADFTSVQEPGSYTLRLEEPFQESPVFAISDTVYNRIFRDALRFFYYSRSGEAITEPYGEGHTRPALFENGNHAGYDYKEGTRDVRGGWFDAGDTHMDTHAPFEAVWWLLETLRQSGSKVQKKSLNLPESASGQNDLVELIKYELDWYEKLRNADGSTHFFVTQHSRHPLPTVSDVSSSAAAVLAALFAKAYPLFKSYPCYAEYADTLLAHAEKSWTWLSEHPGNVSPIDPATGKEYGYSLDDGHDQAIRATAAINLFNATGKPEYNNWFVSRFSNPLSDYHENQAWGGIISGLEQQWINLGYMDYIQSPRPEADKIIIQKLKNEFIRLALWTMARIEYTSYNIPLAAPNHLFWGSSGLIATHAYVYDQVYQWTRQVKFKNAMTHCIDWILGRNPVGRIFVTGYGDALHGVDLYSFFWDDNFNAPPGYLCGNINAFDETTIPIISHPWKRFLNVQSAPTLEPGIYWNAELAWLMGTIAANAGPWRDCNGDPGGTAFTDSCGVCAGGLTGLSPCLPVTAIIHPQADDQIRIYPNPSVAVFHIAGSAGDVWHLFSLPGTLLSSGKNNFIDLKNHPPGIYFLKIRGKTFKIIKK